MRLIYTIFLGTLFLQSCINYAPIPDSKIPLDLRIKKSNEYIKEQKAALNLSLNEKAELIQKNIESNFFLDNYALIAKGISKLKPQRKFGHVEYSGLLLAACSMKYSVQKSPETLLLMNKIVDGLIAMDEANGLDGYMPRMVEEKNSKLVVINNQCHSNAYTHLFLGYYLAAKADATLKDKIQAHSEKILSHYLKHNFNLKTNLGEDVNHSQLNKSSSLSRQLDALVACEFGLYIISNESLKTALKEKLKAFHKRGYHKATFTLFDLGFFRIPTHSSEYLNMMRLWLLNMIKPTEAYGDLLGRVYKNQRKEFNPFFMAIYAGLVPDHQVDLAKMKQYLKSFPLNPSDHEIINSRNEATKLKFLSPIIKNKAIAESKVPLPIYMRPLTGVEWKRNPYRVDGNFHKSATVYYTGVDYLLAYWLSRYYDL